MLRQQSGGNSSDAEENTEARARGTFLEVSNDEDGEDLNLAHQRDWAC